MSLLFGRREETRSLSYQDVWGSGGSAAAIGSGMTSGLALAAVYSATSLIADMISTAIMRAFSEVPGEAGVPVRQALAVQPQYVRNPSPFGTRVDWMHQALASVLLRGNAIGYITALDAAGRPAQQVWFHPDDVTVIEEQADWFHRPHYYWRGRPLDFSLVVHVPGYTIPGSVMGLSPLALFKKQVETGIRAQGKAADWFKNGTTPAGQLQNTSRKVNTDEASIVKQRFKASVGNGDVFVAGADWKYETLGVAASEAQFLETIRATATQIAAVYRVSPEDVGGETGKAMTYKTLEQDNTKLTGRTLSTWCTRFAEVFSQKMLPEEYVRFDLDRLAQGDKTSRMLAYAVGLNTGIETLPEARADEDKAPLTQAELDFWVEHFRNTTPALDVAPPEPKPGAGPSGGPNA